MDDSKPAILPHELERRPASGPPSAVVYFGDEQDVARGFLIALRAMGVAGTERLIESPKPPVRGGKP